MAAVSAQSSPHGSINLSSPTMKGLKKVISDRRRSSEHQDDNEHYATRIDSIDTLHLDRSPTTRSARSSPSRDGSSKSGESTLRTLLPGHAKRKRRKVREEELKLVAEQAEQGERIDRGRELSVPSPPRSLSGRKASSVAGASLLTDDSEEPDERPLLVTRDSHAGYLTTSSPLITTAAVTDSNDAAFDNNQTAISEVEPTKVDIDRSPSPKTVLASVSTPVLPSPGLVDRADSLKPEPRRNSIGRLRAKSPARKFRDVFSKGGRTPGSSPERASAKSSPLARTSTVSVDDLPESLPEVPKLPPVVKSITMPQLITDNSRPLTPPAAIITTPVTTVTPPTPTDTRFNEGADAFMQNDPSTKDNSNVVVSPSGNMISHRRVRSTSSVSHQPSKLSNSITAPLTPTIEENKIPNPSVNPIANRPVSGNFFSSWVSAAQNAATTFQNMTGPNRSRAGTTTSDLTQKSITDPIEEESETGEPESPRKKLAVETLGSGDLNFEHLGLDAEVKADALSRLHLTDLRNDSGLQRDVAAAKAEDVLAKRAVSQAYEKPADSNSTPMAEINDPISQIANHRSQTFGTLNGTGDRTPPEGSVREMDVGSVKRTNSVRSRLANRRSRGSSTATGQSAIGAMISASTTTLINPNTTAPKLSGFAIAPKQRNRNFHQQFRSVPEDDFLIEDYSCALQKEIILAGRLYISEGHICFSSNILGWVTTLVISFDEVVNIERENTALVIPNAIAVQTLHARHTFRSLLSREATYDLLLGIWKVSHPASFQKSSAGRQAAEETTKEAVGVGGISSEKGSEKGSEGSDDDDSDGSDDDDSSPSLLGSNASVAASERTEFKTVSRKPSGMNGLQTLAAPNLSAAGDASAEAPASTSGAPAVQDFPGPATHAPTDCNDASAHYDIVIKDEVLPAPLGKIYSLLYGPQSNAFVRKFLVDECKSLDLQMENDDKKGLNNEKKSRQYTYIKPLGGSIGPKQTKCITTEEIDSFDLEKAVSVTCSTQTPDVPSGNAFVTKTKYCLTWAPGNQTRFQMNCTIEWSAKSWLKGPIEKGAKDGQTQYGDSIVKTLKAAVSRARGTTVGSAKASKKGGKKRKSESKKDKQEKIEEAARKEENWGPLEMLRGPLGPVRGLARPLLSVEGMITVLFLWVFLIWLRGPSGGGVGLGPVVGQGERLVAYEEMWRKEESDLWDWLEERAGVNVVTLRDQVLNSAESSEEQKKSTKKQKQNQKARQKVLKGRDVESRLREESIREREMEEAIRLTRERLEVLEGVVRRKNIKGEA